MAQALYPYQERGAAALAAHDDFLLLDAPRVGKTPSAIKAADRVKAQRVLWLTTGAARMNHGREWLRFQEMNRPIQVRLTGEKQPLPDKGVVIASYDLAAGALHDQLANWHWDVLVSDEFHRLKGRATRRSCATYGHKCDRKEGLAAHAERFWGLSGTPAPNNPSELWPTLHAIFPDQIKNTKGRVLDYWSFAKKYCSGYDGMHGYVITGGRNLDDLKQRMAPISLRRTLAEVEPDLPPIRIPEPIVFEPKAAIKTLLKMEDGDQGQAIRKALASTSDPIKALAAVAGNAQALREMTGLLKVEPVAEMLDDEFEDGLAKIVLFVWHREVADRLEKRLAKYGPCVLRSGLTPTAGQKLQDDFRNDPARKVFIGNIISAGEAIDLSVSDNMMFVEISWTPSQNQQAVYRCTNSAKKRSVLARSASLAGSVDEDIAKAVIRKLKVVSQLFR